MNSVPRLTQFSISSHNLLDAKVQVQRCCWRPSQHCPLVSPTGPEDKVACYEAVTPEPTAVSWITMTAGEAEAELRHVVTGLVFDI